MTQRILAVGSIEKTTVKATLIALMLLTAATLRAQITGANNGEAAGAKKEDRVPIYPDFATGVSQAPK